MQSLLNFINYFSIGSSLLLAFLLIGNPRKVNKKATLWFSAFIPCICLLIFGDALETVKMKPEPSAGVFVPTFAPESKKAFTNSETLKTISNILKIESLRQKQKSSKPKETSD